MEIEYIGEQAWWGHLGHFSVVAAFVTAIFGVIASYFRVRTNDLEGKWKATARILYYAHTAAVLSIFFTLLLMMFNHRFEYQYVWQHSKLDMNMNYILAALWEGQEGSTLLWLLSHAILGLFILRRGGEWEGPVIGVLSLVQIFLSMMLLGVYFGDIHIGSDPFALIRLREENIGLPWTFNPEYLVTTDPRFDMFKDGRGLNPLLQNYWMTIHPPTLFCGFALTTIPFAYAIAGLWTGKLYTWQKPALPWAFTGILVLGTGILMGGAWAYESLSFGGFWAWDPVENASLVPWMILVGAAHVMLINKIKGRSLFTTFLLTIAAFLFIVYSTFLTKSGILSKTSVHAFTEEGLNQELTLFMGFFLWLSVVFLSRNWFVGILYTISSIIEMVSFINGHHGTAMAGFLVVSLIVLLYGYFREFPREKDEEDLWSREFWMFIGSLVLLIASLQIIAYTSVPVISKFLQIPEVHNFYVGLYEKTKWEWLQPLTQQELAPPKDLIPFLNKWQSAFCLLVAALMAITQFFKYRKNKIGDVALSLMWPFIISTVIAIPLGIWMYYTTDYQVRHPDRTRITGVLLVLIWMTTFSILANGKYWLRILKGSVKKAGASIAHIGFSLLIIGAVISTSMKDTISANTSGMDIRSISPEGSNEENIYLRRGDTLPMGDYMVTYSARAFEVRNGTDYVHFNVDFHERDGMNAGEKLFTLRPFIQKNEQMGNASEPDTRHYLHKDIYSYVKFTPSSSLEKEAMQESSDAYEAARNNTLAVGDTMYVDNGIIILDSIAKTKMQFYKSNDSLGSFTKRDTNIIGVDAYFHIIDRTFSARSMVTSYFVNKANGTTRQQEAIDEPTGTKLVFWKVRPENGSIDVYSSVLLSKKPDYVVIEVSEFPAINVLWLGCLVMIVGTAIAIRERIRVNKSARDPEVPAENV